MEEAKQRSRRDGGERKDGSRRDRHREKEKGGDRRSNRERSVEDKHRDKYRDRNKNKHGDLSLQERGKGIEREREEKKTEREGEKERKMGRGRESRKREREQGDQEREKERIREKRRELDGDDDRDADDREHDRRRRRRVDSSEQERDRSSRHREGSEGRKKRAVEEPEEKVKKTREEVLEEEQRKLDEDIEKRRRRVQEWQELKRRKEEDESKMTGEVSTEEPHAASKSWTLEGESDDDEPSEMLSDEEMKSNSEDGDEEEIDPLDAFMNSMALPDTKNTEVEDDESVEIRKKASNTNGNQGKKGSRNAMGRIIQGEDSDSDYEELKNDEVVSEDEDDDEFLKRLKMTKSEKLSIVDHTKIEYPPFRKNIYIEAKEIANMTTEEVTSYRKQFELKIHGKDVPKPIKTWNQTGLPSKILDTVKKLNFEKLMPIQAQALPIIMSGRDCIGIAKTGSGKTLAFVLPMLRHIKDQPLVVPGDGPIGLIMAPTRELVQQIHSDIKKFSKSLGINCVPVYGGSGVAQQISDLKRGTEIVVCTPGRMIDILCTSSGKITNLRRVTYLVMDEADRMFDMGFEPQISRIVQNTRPDRQTVLFSATFPRQVEILARKVLNKPVEIQVGGRSVVNKDITQLVEIRQESERFRRLLELLGEWYHKGKILIFVRSQDKCDSLFRDLIRHGYPCLSLHGAKDQTDRESTVADFKSNVCNLLIATSVAARGLDVKELELVANFDVPNHYEDYVHRVGRTGRAGRKGCAVTFISEEEAKHAPDLVRALELSEQAVPEDLKALADGFMAKVKQGTEQAHGTGYGGSGFKFNEAEEEERKAVKKAHAREYGFEQDNSGSDSEDGGVRKTGVPTRVLEVDAVAPSAFTLALEQKLRQMQVDTMPERYEAELEINDFPQNARWKVTHRGTLGSISDNNEVSITTRGQYYPSGHLPCPGERKLYLFFDGPTELSVKKAKAEVKRVLEDITSQAFSLPGAAQPGKYSVF